jgi:CheY-like chemotaxis protein
MISKPAETPPFHILLVEDNPGDARLAREALKESKINHILYHVEDGLLALDFLLNQSRFPTWCCSILIFLRLAVTRFSRK